MGLLDFLILLLIAGGVRCGCSGDRWFFSRRVAGCDRRRVHWRAPRHVAPAGQTGLPEIFTIDVDGRRFPIIWSIIGGVLFAVIVSLLTRPANRVVY